MSIIYSKEWYPRFYYKFRNKTSNVWYVGQRKHNDVGVKYFGSGPKWVHHCEKHGGHNKDNLELEELVYFEAEQDAKDWLAALEKQEGEYWLEENTKWANQVPENTFDNTRPMLNKETVKKKVSNTNWVEVCEKRMLKMDYTNVGKKVSEAKNKEVWKETVGKQATQKRMNVQNFEETGNAIRKTFSDETWQQTVGYSMREKQKQTKKKAFERPIVDRIRKIAKEKGLKLGRNWWAASDEKLEKMLKEIK